MKMGGNYKSLKAVDTIGNCQRLVFTFGVSTYVCKHMHKISRAQSVLVKFDIISLQSGSESCRRESHSIGEVFNTNGAQDVSARKNIVILRYLIEISIQCISRYIAIYRYFD